MNDAQLKVATEKLTDFVLAYGVGLTLNMLAGVCSGFARVSEEKKDEFNEAADLIRSIGVPIKQLGL